jgi:protein-tyrosine phosphatase
MYYVYTGARAVVGGKLASYLYNDPPVMVAPRIFIGSLASAGRAAEYGISQVINLTAECNQSSVRTECIPFEDITLTPTNIDSVVDQANHAVNIVRAAAENGNVLVHCAAGVNRSAFVIALYLIYSGYSYEQAMKLLTDAAKKRGVPVLTNNSFRTYLYILGHHD